MYNNKMDIYDIVAASISIQLFNLHNITLAKCSNPSLLVSQQSLSLYSRNRWSGLFTNAILCNISYQINKRINNRLSPIDSMVSAI